VTRPVALVTGASGGIGEAIALVLAAAGEDLVLVARSIERLEQVAQALRAKTGREILTIAADLEQPGAAERIAARLAEADLSVRDLVNNAGYGLSGDVAELPRQGQLGILDLNCRALLDLTLVFLPQIIAQRGGVLNVASVAGFTAGPGLAVYYASKAFVVSFTRALAYELKGQGVKVSALCPGPTATQFGARACFRGSKGANLMPSLDAAGVARAGIAGYRAGRVVVVPGLVNRLAVLLLKLAPQAWAMPALSAAQRRRREMRRPVS